MKEPRATALMPLKAYQPAYLAQALHSLLAQSSSAWELRIIIERTDRETLGAVLAPHLLDPRVRVVENEGRKLAGALNTGMSHARTDFVAILCRSRPDRASTSSTPPG